MTTPIAPDQIRNLPTAELALLLLARIARAPEQVHLSNDYLGYRQNFQNLPDKNQLLDRLSDAFAWIESRGFIGMSQSDPHSRWGRLTTDGRLLAEDAKALNKIDAADRLAGALDPVLEAKVRPLFALGDYESACFAAMKQVEVEVRNAAGLENSVIGVNVMRQAFNRETGLLTDSAAEGGEKVATMELFAGAIGAFKNPASHRAVDFDDPLEAAEIVQLADLLLRILRRAQARNRPKKAVRKQRS